MSHADTLETDLSPHGLFSLLVGLYVAATVAPAGTYVLAGGDPAWRVYAVLLGVVAGVTVVVGLAVSRVEERLAVRLGRTRLAWGLPLAGFVYAGWLAAVGSGESVLGLALLGLPGVFFLGLIVLLMATNRAVRDRIGGAPVRGRWSAPAGRRRRRLAKAFAVVSVGGGLLAIVAGGLFEARPVTWLGQMLVPVGAGVFGVTAEREYAVLDEGLVVRAPVALRLVPWDRFEGFAVSDDAVAIRRTEPWRLDVSCDPGAIVDVDAVGDVLSRYLHEER